MIETLEVPKPDRGISEYFVIPMKSMPQPASRPWRLRSVWTAGTLNHAALRDTANSVPPRSGIALKYGTPIANFNFCFHPSGGLS